MTAWTKAWGAVAPVGRSASLPRETRETGIGSRVLSPGSVVPDASQVRETLARVLLPFAKCRHLRLRYSGPEVLTILFVAPTS